MTEETRKQLDQIIDALGLERATGLTREELHREVARTATMMDLCVVLADVIDSLMLDIDDACRRVKLPDIGQDWARQRNYFKELRKLAGATRKWAQRVTSDTRQSERDGDLAGESDWWRNMILLIEDRTGEDELKSRQVIQWLTTMPSLLGLFNIRTRDFSRLIDFAPEQPERTDK